MRKENQGDLRGCPPSPGRRDWPGGQRTGGPMCALEQKGNDAGTSQCLPFALKSPHPTCPHPKTQQSLAQRRLFTTGCAGPFP